MKNPKDRKARQRLAKNHPKGETRLQPIPYRRVVRIHPTNLAAWGTTIIQEYERPPFGCFSGAAALPAVPCYMDFLGVVVLFFTALFCGFGIFSEICNTKPL